MDVTFCPEKDRSRKMCNLRRPVTPRQGRSINVRKDGKGNEDGMEEKWQTLPGRFYCCGM